ncbi:MAG: EAL domain-containing protein [Dongiaceae bacterium]
MMTQKPLQPASDGADSPDAHLDLLAGANRRLQEEISARLHLGDDWQADVLFRAMIDQVPDYLFVKDTESRFVVANRAVAADLDARPEDVIGKDDFELHPPERAAKFYNDEQQVMRSGKPMIDIEEYIIEGNGQRKYLLTSKVPLRNDRNEVIGLVGISRDVTARKRAEEEVHFLAHHDALTRLPNRALFMDRLGQAILNAERNDRWVAIAFIDLDNFKMINDGLGHAAGDELLKAVASRMIASVRSTDTVVRLGGDEFVLLLLDQPANTAAISATLEKVRSAIGQPIELEGQMIQITCSMGLATFPDDGTDPESLVKNADAAMYQAKALGRDNFQFYTAQMNAEVHERISLQIELRQGIARGQFQLAYQPQIDIQSGRVFAAEALVRWNHPVLGSLPPSRFIPIAEESGLIVPLGDWVLHAACRQNKAWQDAGMPPISVSVNVSARQFREKNWIQRVRHALEESGLDPQYLELELTESLIMQDAQQAIATMRELQAVGVHFSIDDFGTGYSSLSALKSFPVARLKIDRSFVRNLPHDENDRGIATAVISLGQKLNMRVIAEGVETDAQLEFLTANHCDEIQGFHFSRPVDPEALADLLRRQEAAVT